MINTIFDLSVNALYWLAHLTGTTYKEINVYLFLVAWPALTVLLAAFAVRGFLCRGRTAS